MASLERVDGRLEERLERVERLLEAMLARPIQVVVMPETACHNDEAVVKMGYTQAELYRLLEFIDREVFRRSRSLEEAKHRWIAIKERLEELSLEELRATLGL